MISYFPSIYPDELLYSQLARYYVKSGYTAYIFAAENLFCSKTVRPDIEFVNKYTPETLQLLTKNMSFDELINQHTMFPYYGRFIKLERKKQAFDALVAMNTDYKNLLPIPKNKSCVSRKLRYCPMCATQDRQAYGETYWHRMHQMNGVNICPVHHCCLLDSSITTSSKQSPTLISAEEVISIPDNIAFSTNDLECRLSEYIYQVFKADIDLQSDTSIGAFLHQNMENTKYLSLRGKKRNMALLHTDFINYYKSIPNNQFGQQWQLQKVFNSNRHNTNEICMLAMLLGISAYNLTHMQLSKKPQHQIFDEKIEDLHKQGYNYQQIANKLNGSYYVVKAIGEGAYGKYHRHSSTSNKSGAKKSDWKTIDSATLQHVKSTIKKLNGDSSTRPLRITIGMIERHLNLSKNGLKHCPQCRSEILKYYETQDEYWTREIIWAINSLETSGKPIHITNIQKLTNIRRKDIIACFLKYQKSIGQRIPKTTQHNGDDLLSSKKYTSE